MLLHTIDINLYNIKKWVILNLGATSHFLALDALIRNKKVAKKPISVTLLDVDQVYSTHTGDLDMSLLPVAVRFCHIIPGVAIYLLISVVKLYKAGRDVRFTKFGIGLKVW